MGPKGQTISCPFSHYLQIACLSIEKKNGAVFRGTIPVHQNRLARYTTLMFCCWVFFNFLLTTADSPESSSVRKPERPNLVSETLPLTRTQVLFCSSWKSSKSLLMDLTIKKERTWPGSSSSPRRHPTKVPAALFSATESGDNCMTTPSALCHGLGLRRCRCRRFHE